MEIEEVIAKVVAAVKKECHDFEIKELSLHRFDALREISMSVSLKQKTETKSWW